MSITDDIVTALEADTNGSTGVADVLTGGIYTYEETGRYGIGRDTTSSAFDSTTGLLKPCMVVKARSMTPDGGVDDDAAQNTSYRVVVELWLYDDGDSGFDTIESARDRAYTVLHGNMIGSSKRIPRWVGNPILDARDNELDSAAMVRADYAVRGVQ